MSQDDETRTLLWWRVLASIGVLNLLLWTGAAVYAPRANAYVAWHLGLSCVFTLVCAYRSWLPRIDLERTTLADTQLSSVVLGRSAATVAEICFASQTALALHELGGLLDLAWMQSLTPVIVVLLTVAQMFCWYSVVTLNHVGHAIEESIWGLTYALVAVLLLGALPSASGSLLSLLMLSVAGSIAYVIFMFTVDVPMYLRRWRAQDPSTFMSVAEGFADAWSRREVTRSWTVWRPEVAWLTGYFSVAVWASQALVWLPR